MNTVVLVFFFQFHQGYPHFLGPLSPFALEVPWLTELQLVAMPKRKHCCTHLFLETWTMCGSSSILQPKTSALTTLLLLLLFSHPLLKPLAASWLQRNIEFTTMRAISSHVEWTNMFEPLGLNGFQIDYYHDVSACWLMCFKCPDNSIMSHLGCTCRQTKFSRSEVCHLGFCNRFQNSLCIHFSGALKRYGFFSNNFFQISKWFHLKL